MGIAINFLQCDEEIKLLLLMSMDGVGYLYFWFYLGLFQTALLYRKGGPNQFWCDSIKVTSLGQSFSLFCLAL